MNGRADVGQTSRAQRAALVLIVDDEAPIAEALAWIVEDAGYAAATATSGQAALEMVQAGARPDLLMTDLMMPKMDGRALIGALRAMLGAAMPPVVLMTAANLRSLPGSMAEAVLAKPFALAEVERLLTRFLAEE
ncbi:MAG TPA: response regulator [Ktedonobacterales bacterium]